MSRIALTDTVRPILAHLRTQERARPAAPRHGPPAEPFITISREAGAGARTLAQQIVQRLNDAFPGERPWTAWDRELVEKVAADHNLSAPLIESLEYANRSLLSDFLGSLSFSDDPSAADEAKVYGRVARTIRALAQAGRVVIVGRGGVFITRTMPGAIHVRLVAPLEHRIEFMSKHHQMSAKDAKRYVRELDRNRRMFFRRYWPEETLDPERFALTINAAQVELEPTLDIFVALVRGVLARNPATPGSQVP